jgi:hypothetical protein
MWFAWGIQTGYSTTERLAVLDSTLHAAGRDFLLRVNLRAAEFHFMNLRDVADSASSSRYVCANDPDSTPTGECAGCVSRLEVAVAELLRRQRAVLAGAAYLPVEAP